MKQLAENDNDGGLNDEQGDGVSRAVLDRVDALQDAGLGRDPGPVARDVAGHRTRLTKLALRIICPTMRIEVQKVGV